ncbi:hypothetical protein AMECASPLE_016856 [Ameca splendens]|uniref:Uncharacterized protein n=1 Tax=Ameca splendens TaxID=208324 RepID=A0ABV0YDD1_9TELE
MSLSVPFYMFFSLSTPLPPSNILLTHNCGSPPPIAGNNPHLRPPRHTVCSPTMHLSSKTFPDTFGLLHVALPLPPSKSRVSHSCSQWHFIVQFHLLCLFSNSPNSPLHLSLVSYDPSGQNICVSF